jgi:hypothetical protein
VSTSAVESTPVPVASTSPDRWKKFILALIMINTVVVALVAGLQADASIRTHKANRDSQYYALQASGELVRQSYQSAYDMSTFSEVLKFTQESLVMQYTALAEQSQGDESGSQYSTLQATVAQARAEQATRFSIFYMDERYAPQADGDIPNMEAYLNDQAGLVKSIVADQNAAADDYHRWNGKASDYVAVLAVLAVAFFLLGLGQSIDSRLRLFLAIFGAVIIGIGVLWSMLVLLG